MFFPKMFEGWGGVGWGVACRGGVCHAGVGWCMSCRGGVGHTGWGGGLSYRGGVGHIGMGWGMLCRGGVGHIGVGWATQGWGGSHRGGMIHTKHYHHLHTVPCGNYLELLREPNSITTTHLITYNY